MLIAALAGRALAAAARRAGYAALVADLFCDLDTQALAVRTARLPGDLSAGIDAGASLPALRTFVGKTPLAAVVLGSGFERLPDLVDAIAAELPLAGNCGAVIRGLKDPHRFAADCAALGIAHPPVSAAPPADPEGWLVKQAGAAGGTHIRPAPDPGNAVGPGGYFQRRMAGRSLSALFVADGRTASIVGFSSQWTAPARKAPFRYGGAVRLRRVPRPLAAAIAEELTALTARVGLLGLGSADYLCAAGACRLIEINPRPGATLDLFDCPEAPLLDAHIRAARGLPFRLPRFAELDGRNDRLCRGADRRFPAIDWPDWTADRQTAGTCARSGRSGVHDLCPGRSAGASETVAEALRGRD